MGYSRRWRFGCAILGKEFSNHVGHAWQQRGCAGRNKKGNTVKTHVILTVSSDPVATRSKPRVRRFA